MQDTLKEFALAKVDFDKLIACFATSGNIINASGPNNDIPKQTESLLTCLLDLRRLLISTSKIGVALQGSRSSLLKAAHSFVTESKTGTLLNTLNAALNEDVLSNYSSSSRSVSAISKQNTRIYAIKADCNHLLDIARATYNENVSDILQLCKDTASKHQLPIILRYSQRNGFSFDLKLSSFRESRRPRLPSQFIHVMAHGGSRNALSMSTLELKKLNRRMQDSLDEVLLLVRDTTADLCALVIGKISVLWKASEAIALVDMLVSLAQHAVDGGHVRPTLGDKFAIKAGRHPLLDQRSVGEVVPNDTYNSMDCNMTLITGPNMSGKTVYLKQIALLAIMSSMGAFVPAEGVTLKPFSTILTRLCNDDDADNNL